MSTEKGAGAYIGQLTTLLAQKKENTKREEKIEISEDTAERREGEIWSTQSSWCR